MRNEIGGLDLLPERTMYYRYHAIVIKTRPSLKTPSPQICPWARIFKTPPTQIAPQAKFFETRPGELGKFGGFRSPRARSARKILGLFALENSVFNEIWVCLLQNFETPPGQIGEFLRIFETPPTQIGPWARIFETPPDELVAGGDLKGQSRSRHTPSAETDLNGGS